MNNQLSKQAERELAGCVVRAKSEAGKVGALASSTTTELRVLLARLERSLLMAGDYSPDSRTKCEAMNLLARYDRRHAERTAELHRIDVMTAALDAVMRDGAMPCPRQLRALARAVMTFEDEHSIGDDFHLTAAAWDLLAQCEAGLWQPLYDHHYQAAALRYAQAALVTLQDESHRADNRLAVM